MMFCRPRSIIFILHFVAETRELSFQKILSNSRLIPVQLWANRSADRAIKILIAIAEAHRVELFPIG